MPRLLRLLLLLLPRLLPCCDIERVHGEWLVLMCMGIIKPMMIRIVIIKKNKNQKKKDNNNSCNNVH